MKALCRRVPHGAKWWRGEEEKDEREGKGLEDCFEGVMMKDGSGRHVAVNPALDEEIDSLYAILTRAS